MFALWGNVYNTTCHNIQEFCLDLDRVPEERWSDIAPHYKQYSKQLKYYIRAKKCDMLGNSAKFFGKSGQDAAEHLTKNPCNGLDEYWREMVGLSKALEIEVHYLAMFNYGCDLSTSGINAIVKNNNRLHHLRVMDWDFGFLKNLLCFVNFIKNDKIIFRSLHILGLVGVQTAITCKLSVSADFMPPKTNFTSCCKLKKALKYRYPASFHLRRSLEQNHYFYDDMVNELAYERSMYGNALFTVCSKDRGCFIKRTIDTGIVIGWTGNPLVMTNYEIVSTSIGTNAERFRKLVEFLSDDKNCRNDYIQFLLYVLNAYPIKFSDTLYSVIMIPKKNTLFVK